MHVKTFYPVHINDPITITVDDNFITFYRGIQTKSDMYWVAVGDWDRPISTWPDHMERKSWFNSDMRKFINKSLELPDSGLAARFDTITNDDLEIMEISRQNNGIIRGGDIKHIVMKKYFGEK